VDRRAGEPHPVAEVPALLGAGGVPVAVAHRRRHLGQPEAAQGGADHQLGRLVLRLLERDRRSHLGAHRPQPTGRVSDRVADENADQGTEHDHAGVAGGVGGELGTEAARARDEVGLA